MFLAGAGSAVLAGVLAGCSSGSGDNGTNATDTDASGDGTSLQPETATDSDTTTAAGTETNTTALRDDGTAADTDATDTQTAPATSNASPTNATSEQQPTAAAGTISKQQARQIATDRVGGSVLNVENDSTDNVPVYEVEVTRENGTGKELTSSARLKSWDSPILGVGHVDHLERGGRRSPSDGGNFRPAASRRGRTGFVRSASVPRWEWYA